jgi:septum formation protein
MAYPLKDKIILASASPRRRALLKELCWDFTAEEAKIKETRIADEDPADMVLRLANLKADYIFSKNDSSWVIGADTVVVINNEILGKPNDKAEAINMIEKLQGREHTVMTGIVLISPKNIKLSHVEKTKVKFRQLTRNEIEAYVSCSESLDKAGSYAIQGHGMLLVEKIEGCYFNVVGLPIESLSKMFVELGWSLDEQWRIHK